MKRQAGKKIRVTFGDGVIIEEANACDTLINAIKKIGVKKVADLKIVAIGSQNILLLDKKLAEEKGYRNSQKEMGFGYYLVTKTSTEKKVCDLCTIAQKLSIDMKVEIVEAKPKTKVEDNKVLIETSCGNVERIKDVWYFQPTSEDDNLCWIPFTDHWTYDTLILKHEGKYGLFTLPNMADYGNNGSLKWKSFDKEPFPYDEVKIKGMGAGYWGMMAYRIKKKWGISNFLYSPHDGCVLMVRVVPCSFASLEEAEKHLASWRNPFQEVSPKDEKTVEPDFVITEDVRMENLPRFDEFFAINAGALQRYKKMTIKQFKSAYYRDSLKGRGKHFFDKLLQYVNSLLKKEQ